MSARSWIVVAVMLATALTRPAAADAQVTKDVTRYLTSATSATRDGHPNEAKDFVDQAAAAARTAADWRAVAESYRSLGDDERWSWALDRSSRPIGRRRRW